MKKNLLPALLSVQRNTKNDTYAPDHTILTWTLLLPFCRVDLMICFFISTPSGNRKQTMSDRDVLDMDLEENEERELLNDSGAKDEEVLLIERLQL